jgi:hippurate hydrolase
MDALPITEETDLPYASTSVGRMHACGHDGHTAVLLSAASVLADRRARLPQPVKLIFQPAEELRGGAKRMVEEGVLEEKIGGHRVARLFGLHGWPGLPLHTVGSRPGPIMASMDNFTITVRGRGAHGAAPHQGRDPLLAASHVVTALQSVVGREIDPADAAVLTVGSFQAGQSPAVMPESAELTGTIRALRAETASAVQKRVREIAESTAQALGCTAETTWQMGYPPTVNDETCHARVLETARAALGPDHTTTLEAPSMAAEDFAFYQQTAAGAFFFLGLCPPEHSAWPGLYTPRFDFHDEALRTGTRMMCELALADHGGGPAARTCR